MSQERYKLKQIMGMLRGADIEPSQGEKDKQVCRNPGILEPIYYCWRNEFGGAKLAQVKSLGQIERENSRLKEAVSELTLEKLVILKGALEGCYL